MANYKINTELTEALLYVNETLDITHNVTWLRW